MPHVRDQETAVLDRFRDTRVTTKLWIIVAIAAIGVIVTGWTRLESVRPRSAA